MARRERVTAPGPRPGFPDDWKNPALVAELAPPPEPTAADHLRTIAREELVTAMRLRPFCTAERFAGHCRTAAQAWRDAAVLEEIR